MKVRSTSSQRTSQEPCLRRKEYYMSTPKTQSISKTLLMTMKELSSKMSSWFSKRRSFIFSQEDKMSLKEFWRARIFKQRQGVTTPNISQRVPSLIKDKNLSLRCSSIAIQETLITSSTSREFSEILTRRRKSWSTTSTKVASFPHSWTVAISSLGLVTDTLPSMIKEPHWTRLSSKDN